MGSWRSPPRPGPSFNKALELGRITQIGSAVAAGQEVEWVAGRAVRTVVGVAALKGLGGIGLVKTVGETVGKGTLEQSAEDVFTGKLHKAGHDFKQRVGLEAPPLPDAEPAAEIEALLNGEKAADRAPENTA